MIKFGFYSIITLIVFLMSCSKSDKNYGVDLSHHNTVYDWNKVTASFIYLKATEGTTFRDPKFDDFVVNAQKRNIPVGAYHFMTTSSSAESQFSNFKKVVDRYKMDLIPVLDIEKQTKGHRLSAQQLRKRVRTFVNLCKRHYGVAPIIYCGQSFYGKYFLGYFNDCMYWCGNVNSPAILPHVIHQKTIKAVPGIKGRVDYNILNCKLNKIRL